MKNSFKNQYIAPIDGLRAIAVISVIIFHLDHSLLPGGFTGVDVFFVISGYVISKSLAASEAINFRLYLLGFYKRRLLRIMPALFFCLLATSVASAMFIPDGYLSRFNDQTGLWAFFGVSNFYLVSTADGYFAEGIPFNPFIHTWSLAVEEQFYLLFPLVLYLWLKRQTREAPKRILARYLLPALATGSLLFSIYETQAAPINAFYLLPSRFWELAAGALLFQFNSRGLIKAKTLRQSRSLMLGGGAVTLIGFVFVDASSFPFPWALFPVLGTCLMIAGIIEEQAGEHVIQKFLQSLPMIYIGRLSYSLYLWHWSVFSLFHWTIGLQQPVQIVTATVLMTGLSIFSYHFVEKPIRSNRFLRRQPDWKIVSGGIGAVLVAVACAFLMFKYDDQIGLSLSVTNDKCKWRPWYTGNCSDVRPERSVLKTSDKQIFALGDSHIEGYTAMLKSAERVLGVKVHILGRPGCAIAGRVPYKFKKATCDSKDLQWVEEQANPGDIVFLASLRVPRLSNHYGAFDEDYIEKLISSPEAIEQQQLAFREATRIIEYFQSLGIHVLIDLPKPVFRAPPYRCSDWFNSMNPVCAPGFVEKKTFLMKHRELTVRALERIEQSHKIFIWDPFPILCSSLECSAFDGDDPLFLDGDHLSGYANRKLLPSFISQILSIWGEEITPSSE